MKNKGPIGRPTAAVWVSPTMYNAATNTLTKDEPPDVLPPQWSVCWIGAVWLSLYCGQ